MLEQHLALGVVEMFRIRARKALVESIVDAV